MCTSISSPALSFPDHLTSQYLDHVKCNVSTCTLSCSYNRESSKGWRIQSGVRSDMRGPSPYHHDLIKSFFFIILRCQPLHFLSPSCCYLFISVSIPSRRMCFIFHHTQNSLAPFLLLTKTRHHHHHTKIHPCTQVHFIPFSFSGNVHHIIHHLLLKERSQRPWLGASPWRICHKPWLR